MSSRSAELKHVTRDINLLTGEQFKPKQAPARKREIAQKIFEIAEALTEQMIPRHTPGQHKYYAAVSLREAVKSAREGNYGIGGVVLYRDGDWVYEFRERNFMITGLGVSDHAEARGLERAGLFKALAIQGRNLEEDVKARFNFRPDSIYQLGKGQHDLPQGWTVYGTLEPCPMCTCKLINFGANHSFSISPDDMAANALRYKRGQMAVVWKNIMNGIGLDPRLVPGIKSESAIRKVADALFHATRTEIDLKLAERAQVAAGKIITHPINLGALDSHERPLLPAVNKEPAFNLRTLNAAADLVTSRFLKFQPEAAVVLGTGFKSLTDGLEIKDQIPFSDIPGIRELQTVSGHGGRVLVASSPALGGRNLLIWDGRVHPYQLENMDSERTPLAVIPFVTAKLKAKFLISCMGVGGIKKEPNSVVVFNGHSCPPDFNLFPGRHLSIWREEFPRSQAIYNEALIKQLVAAVNVQTEVKASAGSYYFWPGKQFQTDPEIRALMLQGYDTVGKSFVPEAMYAAQLEVPVVGLGFVTNWAQGILADSGPNHKLHLQAGVENQDRLKTVLQVVLSSADEFYATPAQ